MTKKQNQTGGVESPPGHAEGQSPSAGLSKMAIHFVKSSQFRVVHASGVWYGGDAQQNLHLTFFNERNPIPKKLVLLLNDQGMIVGDDPSEREAKEGIVREMEVDVILSFQAAVELHKTLGDNLKAIQQTLKSSDEHHKV